MTSYTPSGARRTGDEYQDLQSADVLIEWLEHPDAYRWVHLETTEGWLDDIQAELTDGSRRLLQVKFGTDDFAEWEWEHLTKQERGQRGLKHSLLQKWKTSLDDVVASGVEVSEAALLTNRAASAAIRAHLSDSGLVDFDNLPDSLQATISEQLDGHATASKFFASFRFYFRERSFEALGAALWERFSRLGGSSEGWSNLMRRIRLWINRKDEPSIGGKIALEDVRAAGLWRLPPQIPQDFLVPNDYVAPMGWSKEAVEPRLRADGDKLVVVTGSPGAGKSTYLSWLVEHVRSTGIPVVRHHYFLSTADPTSYRTDWETAAEAIMGQLRSEYPELVRSVDKRNSLPGTLREFLVAAGHERADKDPLMVIVDGLDHVWRDTGSAEELRQLFDLILPVPDGVMVIVGTQDVHVEKLPRKLRDLCLHDQWQRVPVLDGDGVHEWLQHHAHELGLPDDEYHSARILGELAGAFHDVSSGHPLILHYTLGAARQGAPLVRADQVRELPSFDPESNVAAYYRALWESISPEGHHLLHLLAGFQWAWPRDGLVQCLAPQSDLVRLEEAERAIWHVLGTSRAGVTAFHESLLAFVRVLPSHQYAARSLRPQVIDWLAHHAPDYWRWRYEHEERARNGDTGPLISSATLDWCVDSLVAGRSRKEVAEVVGASGWAALGEGHLQVATERQYIGTYLDEAQHAGDVLAKLVWLALNSCAPRPRELELNLFLSRKAQASNEEIEAAAEVAFSAGHLALCQELLREGLERWNAAVRSERLGDTFKSLQRTLSLLIAASLTNPSQEPYQRHISEHGCEPGWCPRGRYAKALARLCVIGGDTQAIREELRFLANQAEQVSFEAVDEIVRIAWRDGFDPAGWIENPEARKSGMFRCDQLWVRRATDSSSDGPQTVSFVPVSQADYYESETLFIELTRSYFFSCLAAAAEGRPTVEAVGLEAEASEVRSFVSMLGDLATEAADYKNRGHAIGADWLFAQINNMEPPKAKQYDLANRFVRSKPVARIVVAIAQDLEELHRAETGETTLTGNVIMAAVEGAWTWAQIWVEETVERRIPASEHDAVRYLIDRERARLENARDYVHTRAEEYATLAQFCQLHQAPADETRALARLAAMNLLGHGFRKDTVLDDVLEAVHAAPNMTKARALTLLQAISPVVQVIDEITDGKETRHLERKLAGVVKDTVPESLPTYLRALQRRHHHWQVEDCFTHLAKAIPLRTVYEKALATTLVHEEALTVLQDRVDNGEDEARSILAHTLATFGRQAVAPKESRGSSGAPREGSEDPPPFEDYPPERLEEFVGALRDARIYGDEVLADWTAHWRSKEPDRLLASLVEYRAAHGFPHARENGKMVVELALERSGVTATWEWLVAYHEALYGWHWFYRLTDVKWIWEFVATRFKARWLDFITETSRPRWSAAGGGPRWSIQRMIGYLQVVGRADRVDEVLDAAVRWSSGLAADMRLPDPALTPDESELPLALRLLVDRLDCPSRMVQERAMWSLAGLFADTETRDDTTRALLDWHAVEPIEMRSCTLLLLLRLSCTAHGASAHDCVAVARKANLVPSIGADLLLRELGEEGASLATSLDYWPRHSQHPTSGISGVEAFEDAVRAYLAPIFLRWADSLDKSSIPFTRKWKQEAVELVRQQGSLSKLNGHFDYHYRGSANEPALAINDSLSTVLRSAYLRALHWSVNESALQADRAAIHARRVGVMADPTLWAVRPSERPDWWPEDSGETDGLDTLGQAVGQAVRSRLEQRDADAGEILLFAGGPVGNRTHLHAEVEIRAYLQSAHGPIKPRREELSTIPQVACRPLPPRVSLPGTYKNFDEDGVYIGDWLVAPLAWRLIPNTEDWLLPERQTRGFCVPANWLFPDNPTVTTEPRQVSFMLDDQRIGYYRYWHDELRERHYLGTGSRVGGELQIRREWIESHLRAGATLCWIVTLWIAQREEYTDKFDEPQLAATWLVGGSQIVFPKPWGFGLHTDD